MKTKIDYNSVENQRIKGKFVSREVYTCFSYEMASVFEASSNQSQYDKGYPLPTYEDIENLYLDVDKYYQDYGYESADCMRDDGADCQEIFEWWIVSKYLYRKLKEKDEPVLEWGNNYYWGRTTTGQAILLDRVISEICGEMEILEGQRYSWAEKKINKSRKTLLKEKGY